MFWKTSRRIERLEDELKEVRERYWELRRDHARLLSHLGLREEKVIEHTVIKKVD